MPTIRTDDGTELYYQDIGSGEPIVFLHGGFMHHRVWDRQVAALQGECRLIVPDLRGHGRSAKPTDGYEPARFARDVESLLVELGVKRATLIGWSLGATVATAYLKVATREPDAVILTASGIFQEFADEEESDQGLDVDALIVQHRSNPPAGMEAFVEELFAEKPSEAERRWLWSIGMETPLRVVLAVLNIYRTVDYDSLQQALSDADTTVGVFHGAYDGAASLAAAKQVATELVDDGRFVPFDESGHVPFLEEPDKFTKALRNMIGLDDLDES